MEPVLEKLMKLQEIDLRIHDLEQSKVDFPKEVEQREQAVTEVESESAKIGKKLEENEKAIQSVNDSVTAAQSALDKSQERLNAIKTNREYDAVHAEIETHKSTITGAQTKIKALNAEKEKIVAAVAEAAQKLEQTKADNEPVIAELKTKIANIDSQIAEIAKERTVVMPDIPKHYLSAYDFIRRKRKTGHILSFVNENRTCGICFKVLEPRLIVEIKRGTKLPSCENCGSLLIWKSLHDSPAAQPEPEPKEKDQSAEPTESDAEKAE
jgi:hypothetical protein